MVSVQCRWWFHSRNICHNCRVQMLSASWNSASSRWCPSIQWWGYHNSWALFLIHHFCCSIFPILFLSSTYTSCTILSNSHQKICRVVMGCPNTCRIVSIVKIIPIYCHEDPCSYPTWRWPLKIQCHCLFNPWMMNRSLWLHRLLPLTLLRGRKITSIGWTVWARSIKGVKFW